MVHCVTVVLILAFIRAVCANEVSSINQLFHENFSMPYPKKPHKERFTILCTKAFLAVISQQVILQKGFSM